jgi:hypothetical protein
MKAFENEAPRMPLYREFAEIYEVKDLETLVRLYDVHELMSFMPSQPTAEQKEIFNQLMGVTIPSGYMDYQKSNNTFELIMQWQEKTGAPSPVSHPSDPDLKD